MPKGDRLTTKELDFCKAYIETRNCIKAAAAAGYSNPNSIGSMVLNRPKIKAYIDRAIDRASRASEITAERVLEEIAKIAFGNLADIVTHKGGKLTIADFEALTPDQRAMIEAVAYDGNGNVIIKTYDKLKALEKLGKHLKLFTDVQETKHSFKQMGQVQIVQQSVDGSTTETKALTFNVGSDPKEAIDVEHINVDSD